MTTPTTIDAHEAGVTASRTGGPSTFDLGDGCYLAHDAGIVTLIKDGQPLGAATAAEWIAGVGLGTNGDGDHG